MGTGGQDGKLTAAGLFVNTRVPKGWSEQGERRYRGKFKSRILDGKPALLIAKQARSRIPFLANSYSARSLGNPV